MGKHLLKILGFLVVFFSLTGCTVQTCGSTSQSISWAEVSVKAYRAASLTIYILAERSLRNMTEKYRILTSLSESV